MICRICNLEILNNPIEVKDRMGTLESFSYLECNHCGCLQIEQCPKDISLYYQNYYTDKKAAIALSMQKNILWKIRALISFNGGYPIIDLISPNTILKWANIAKIKRSNKILDVGCGSGDILYEFHKHGFKNLSGIDPMLIKKNLPNRIKFQRATVFDINERFDFIMLNHTFEHIWEQDRTLRKINEILKENGTLMIRIPIKNKAFEEFKENWYQIDAPRHFYLHSPDSLKLLYERNGFEMFHSFYDSTFMQFVGSLEYKNNIDFNSTSAYRYSKSSELFSKYELELLKEKAVKYNKENHGDQAVFFFRK